MANRRMLNKTVVESDPFFEMPADSQALYMHLVLNADDEGFVGNPETIRRMTGFSKDSLKLLIAKGFLISFQSGVVVVTHWEMQNKIQPSRKTKTIFTDEKGLLIVDEQGKYLIFNNSSEPCQQDADKMSEECQRVADKTSEQVSIGKDSIGKDSIDKASVKRERKADKPPRPRFTPPSEDEAINYFDEQGSSAAEAKSFLDYYAANGWKVGGRATMKNWQAAARNWIRRAGQYSHPQTKQVAAEPATDTISRAAERLASGNFSNLEDAFL